MSKRPAAPRSRENPPRRQAGSAPASAQRPPRRWTLRIWVPHLIPRADELGAWLAEQARAVRMLIAGLIAISLTAALATFLFGYLFSLRPDEIQFGPVTADNVLAVSLTFLTLSGLGFYWNGWRLLIGFDFGDDPLTPGRGAARWVLFGLGALLLAMVVGLVSLVVALSPM